jgi:TetR/AcrR family transcriptional repressor of nem operon
LIEEACELALKQNVAWLRGQMSESANPPKSIIEFYLSPTFRDMPGYACLMAALGPEISRRGNMVRRITEKYTQEFVDVLAQIVPGGAEATRRDKALTIYASLIGALILARAVADPDRQTIADEEIAEGPASSALCQSAWTVGALARCSARNQT